MAKTGLKKLVLFLGTGPAEVSRFVETQFNAVSARIGLPWQGFYRDLHHDATPGTTAPGTPVVEDLKKADRIVALNHTEHRPLLQALCPNWVDKVEFWEVPPGPKANETISNEISGLVARILSGGQRQGTPQPEPPAAQQSPNGSDSGKPLTAKVGRETAGRRGKGVIVISDLALNEEGLKNLAATLKQRCGTGGTVKDGRIEIQGDQRDRVVTELEKLGYKVKRVGV